MVVLCRLVPGVFIALIACGWARVSFARFMAASLIVSALYLPVMLYLVVASGDALDDHMGLWAWPLLIGVIAVAGFVRTRVFSFDDAQPGVIESPPAVPTLSALPSRVQVVPRPAKRPSLS